MKRKNCILFVLILGSNLLFSQGIINDSISLKKVKQFTNSNNDSLLYYANQLKKSDNLCNYYRGLNMEAKALYQKKDVKAAKEITLFVLKSLKETNKDCTRKNKVNAFTRLFWIHKNQNEFEEAFQVLLKRKEIIKNLEIKDDYYEANLISNDYYLGVIKIILGFHKEARELLKATIPKLPRVYKNLDRGDYYLTLNKSSTYNLIGESYLKDENNASNNYLDSASIYFRKAFEVASKFKPIHKNSETLYNLREAEVLIARNKHQDALKLINDYSAHQEQYKTEQNINSLKAICFYQLKNNDSTLYYCTEFLKKFDKNKSNKKRLISVYDILSNQYYNNNQIDSAYKYSELTLKEIKNLNENKNEVNKAHYLYDFKNAVQLNKTISVKEKNNTFALIIFIIVILVASILIVLYLLKKGDQMEKEFIKIKDKRLKKPEVQKKEYNLDQELTKELLEGIITLENGTDFLDQNFSIQTLAKKLNTNTSYLSYTINRVKNKSFKQYITELRINYLIAKLQEKDSKYKEYTIQYLAEQIGYKSASAFTRAFKKHQGMTPSEFLKSLE